MEWAVQLEHMDKRVAHDHINGCDVSTVWLGLDHNYYGGPPLVFETMVFKGTSSEIYCDRYSTWADAEAGHQKAIEWVKNKNKEEDK